ncbi:hypothetical protein ACFWP5_37395 [Streptomyces sp. NPDC058469]|uniref:hypothetical protein n=1 Tax=Streptomyces sp. NPDC058469 TaxID=3346514 RepID=UPI0036653196
MRLKKPRFPLAGTLTLGLLTAVGVTLLVTGDGSGHLAANRAQLKKACGGLLPYDELSDRVPDDARGSLDQYGTLLQPGQESRSLLNCSLEWGDRGGVHVEAATLVNHLPYALKTDDLLSPGYEAPGVTGRASDDDGNIWIVAECPNGLAGRARSASQMYVSVGVSKASVHTEFRVAVQVANAVARREHCGSALKSPTRVIRVDEPGRSVAKCGWMSAKDSAPAPGTWTAVGDLQQSPLLSVCSADRRRDSGGNYSDPQATELDPVALDATSWSGELGRSAYRDYVGDGEYPGLGPGPDAVTNVGAQLALWARSECVGGTTYHRVSVSPNIDSSLDLDYGGFKMTEAARAELSGSAKKLMTTYLNAPAGWPKTQHCHDTKLLGEVEQWS